MVRYACLFMIAVVAVFSVSSAMFIRSTFAPAGRMLDLYGGAVNNGLVSLDSQYYKQFVPPFGGQGPSNSMDLVMPKSLVYLNANVTDNLLPVPNTSVTFNVYEPNGTFYTGLGNLTDANGVATTAFTMPWPTINPESLLGLWTATAQANVSGQIVTDTTPFEYDYLAHIWRVTTGAYVYTYGGIVSTSETYGTSAEQFYQLFSLFQVVDNSSTTISSSSVTSTFGGAFPFGTYQNYTRMLGLYIPFWASTGIATVHADCYNQSPSSGGILLGPEYVGPTITIETVQVTCSPSFASSTSTVTCNATIVGGNNPTGNVNWTTSSVTGNFNQSTCTLSSGTCSTTYTDNNTGYVTMTASYGGDVNNPACNGNTILTVYVNVTTGANATVTPTDKLQLIFFNVSTPGFTIANQTSTVNAPAFNTTVEPYYNIIAIANFSNVEVCWTFDGSNMTQQQKANLTMWQYTPIPGDIRPDYGKVDMKDIGFIARQFGTTPNSPTWDPTADITGPVGKPDGRVDMRDIALAARNFGKTSNWTNITTFVDTTNNIIYGTTTHFSFIAIH